MEPTQQITNSLPPLLAIPESIQSIVYLVGMVGFPVVVALFVLIRLGDKLKSVDERLTDLAGRISERPLGLEKSTDFIIYLCESLGSELKANLREIISNSLVLTPDLSDKKGLSKCLTVIRREMSRYFRPIFRKHQRFASRFPTVGGNLGSMFFLASPAEDIEAGQTEASLVGQTYKDPAEALLAIVMNNIGSFSDPKVIDHDENNEGREEQPGNPSPISSPLMSPDKFYTLTADAIDTVCLILRDSMIGQVRLNASEFEGRVEEMSRKRNG